jgi:diguanylate cyclase
MRGEQNLAKDAGSCAVLRLPQGARSAERRALESVLCQDGGRRELQLFYQPQMDLLTGNIVGIEALIRWHHDGSELVSPAQIIAAAKQCGLMVPLGRWVLREACSQAQIWQRAGFPSMRIAINVSAEELHARDFVTAVRSILVQSGLAASLLELEMTESPLVPEARLSAIVLRELKQMDVKLALTIGTRYRSLIDLKGLRIDTVKLDRSIVRYLGTDRGEAGTVCALLRMSKALRMQIVADGVERREQLEFLQQHGCPYGQGFYFGQPASSEEVTQMLLRAQRRRTLLTMGQTSISVAHWFRRQAGRSAFAEPCTSVRWKDSAAKRR